MINLSRGDAFVLIIPSESEIHYFGSCNDRISNNVAPRQFTGIITLSGEFELCSSIGNAGSEIKYLNLFNSSSSDIVVNLAVQNNSGTVIVSTIELASNKSKYLSKSEIDNKILFNLSVSSNLYILPSADCDINYSSSFINYGRVGANKPIQTKGLSKIPNYSLVCSGNKPAGTGLEYMAFQNNQSSACSFIIAYNYNDSYIKIKSITIEANESLYVDRNTINEQVSSGSVTWSDISGRPTSSPMSIDIAVASQHSHSNQTVLDEINDVDGKLYYGSNRISEITEEDSIVNAIIFG